MTDENVLRRARLIEPHAHSRVSYAKHTTRLASGLVFTGDMVRLSYVVDVPTRVQRLIIRAATVFPWWVILISTRFSWVVLPWAERDWDNGEWRFTTVRPTYRLIWWWDRKYQARALDQLLVRDIRIGGPNRVWFSAFIESIPATMFAELAIGSRLEMPTASPGQEIVVELYGTGGPITVDLVSEILLPEAVS